jgi:hypothetical protein
MSHFMQSFRTRLDAAQDSLANSRVRKKLANESGTRASPKNWRELNWKGKRGMLIYRRRTKQAETTQSTPIFWHGRPRALIQTGPY